VLRSRDDLPLITGALEPEAGALVRRRELSQGGLDRARRSASDAAELTPRDRLFGDEEDGLDRVR